MKRVIKSRKLYIEIKKIFKLIVKPKKKSLKNKDLVINSVGSRSTLMGRKKVEYLKKIGRKKREYN